jgi:WhiB family redox-sensing transcriptional regulator
MVAREMLATVDDPFLEMLAAKRPAWMARARCRGLPSQIFFLDRGQPSDAAKRICDGCEVNAECLDYAISHNETLGIWGGTTLRERKAIRTLLEIAATG